MKTTTAVINFLSALAIWSMVPITVANALLGLVALATLQLNCYFAGKEAAYEENMVECKVKKD